MATRKRHDVRVDMTDMLGKPKRPRWTCYTCNESIICDVKGGTTAGWANLVAQFIVDHPPKLPLDITE